MTDLVTTVEAAYRLDLDDGQWLDGILDAATKELDAGLGIAGMLFDATSPEAMRKPILAARGRILEDIGIFLKIDADAGASVMAEIMLTGGCATASELLGHERFLATPAFQNHGFARGYHDWMQVNAVDPTRIGCQIGAPMPVTAPVAPSKAHAWNRIAAHMTAGLRLRRAAQQLADSELAAEAVLDVSGKVKHAEEGAKSSSAREALRNAAVAVDRARGKLRRTSPDEALDAWKALVAGRWSLVDRFERNGSRYLVAVSNAPSLRDPRALSPRERQVAALLGLGHSNKVIAYTLGLSVSRVGTLVASAATKLGVGSRVELVQLIRALAAGNGQPGSTETTQES